MIGVHNGIINFTIGQRKGIKVSDKDALYVIKIDAKKNEIIDGDKRLKHANNEGYHHNF